MHNPYLSVIICTYNREIYILPLLESLAVQEIDKSEFEIVFVNNNSTDNTEVVCNIFKSKYPQINFKYFVEKKQGLSHARNRGIIESKGEITIFIDDDALACNNYLKGISEFFRAKPDVVAAGGKILPKYESQRPKWMTIFLEPVMSLINLGNKIKSFPKNKFPIGANMYFRKLIFNEVGFFNTNLGRTGKKMLGGEEKDIFNKIRSKGYDIFYIPYSYIYHIIPDSRLTEGFIKKQAYGIGFSERIRCKSGGKGNYFKSMLIELIKWNISLILFIFYFLILKLPKALMLIKFRLWVSAGLLAKITV